MTPSHHFHMMSHDVTSCDIMSHDVSLKAVEINRRKCFPISLSCSGIGEYFLGGTAADADRTRTARGPHNRIKKSPNAAPSAPPRGTQAVASSAPQLGRRATAPVRPVRPTRPGRLQCICITSEPRRCQHTHAWWRCASGSPPGTEPTVRDTPKTPNTWKPAGAQTPQPWARPAGGGGGGDIPLPPQILQIGARIALSRPRGTRKPSRA
eukprot:gene21481-biopygen10180